ncbi:transporter substrate-binding domain-containing protein [Salininema proteolyticum]|uniref:Transporter substrate-binding domain-containing protein n=1 Tax=Salininema proteolyticum TaxID=1607685 RepID=A0ABV8TV64_9ACTN
MSQRTNLNRRTVIKATGGGAAALALATSGCSKAGRDELSEDLSDTKIKIAYGNENPYAYFDPELDDVVGTAVSVHNYILKQFGAKEENIEWVDPGWDGLIPGLGNGHDIVIAGMFINEKRCAAAAFADPDYVMPDRLMVPKGNPKNLSDIQSIVAHEDAVIGVMNGTTEQDNAKELGLADERINTQSDLAALILELKAGRCDAIALTAINLQIEADSEPDLEVTDAFYPTTADGEEIIGAGAAVFHADDKDFRDKYNEKIAELLSDTAKWEELVGPFGFTAEDNLPDDGQNAEHFCPENYQ